MPSKNLNVFISLNNLIINLEILLKKGSKCAKNENKNLLIN